MTDQVWNYSYRSTISWFYTGGGDPNFPVCTYGDCVAPQCTSDACAGTLVTEVSGPQSFTRYTFGNSYRYNEGKLLMVETGASAANVLRTQRFGYQWPTSSLPYVTQLGYSLNNRSDSTYTEAFVIPEREVSTLQDGGTYSRKVEQFDLLARPVRIRRTHAVQ